MNSEIDQLALLRQMRSEGRISDEEFDDLTRGFVADEEFPAEEEIETEEPVQEESDPDPEPDQETAESEETAVEEDWDPFVSPRFRDDLSVNYLGGMLIASVILLLSSALGALSWFVALPAILVLLSTLLEGWRKVTVVGAAVVAGIMILGLLFSGVEAQPQTQQAAGTLPPRDPDPPIAGSLGIYMNEITDMWNTVEGPPQISKGLTRNSEPGEYDSFIYRFGDWGRLAGAYDPSNDAVYALLATGQFSGSGTDQLYLHLCFVVAPFSQECIDQYFEVGLDYGTLEDFIDVTHNAEWALDDHIWRLEIDGNVVTIRVLGSDVA